MHHIPVLNHIVLSFNVESAGIPTLAFRSIGVEISEMNHLGPNEALFKIRMNNTCCSRSLGTSGNGPGTNFLFTGREVGDVVEQLVR